jgi:Leucine carboxyl methyltransferase
LGHHNEFRFDCIIRSDRAKDPTIGDHFVKFQGARTKYFDEYFRRAADAGVRQVVSRWNFCGLPPDYLQGDTCAA